MVYNVLSCSGWESGAAGWVASGGCLMARLGIILLFFVIAIVRKWGGEELGVGFSFLFSLIGGFGAYFLVVLIWGSFKLAFVIGFISALVFGYGAGIFFDEGG